MLAPNEVRTSKFVSAMPLWCYVMLVEAVGVSVVDKAFGFLTSVCVKV